VDPTVKKVLTGAGLIGVSLAGAVYPGHDYHNLKEAVKKTGKAKDDKETREKILTAHQKFTPGGKPKITFGGYEEQPWPEHAIQQYSGAQSNQKLQINPATGETRSVPIDEVAIGNKASQFIFAHELGHREISKNPKDNPIKHFAQEKAYGGIHPLIKDPALFAIGLVNPSTRRALAYGMAANYLNYSPMLLSEHGANVNAQKYLQEIGQPVDKSIPRGQLANYAINSALESAIPLGLGIAARGAIENPHIRDFAKTVWKEGLKL
tara:strand:+ start:362 stop:1156 length:795 start_codon:yes stop_codon:yes gene_type:complete